MTLENRVAALEQMAREHSNRAGLDDRLVVGVERLGDETSGLNAILTKVDEQQQRMTVLGRDLERVEKNKVGKEDLEANKREQAQITMDFRKRTLIRIYTTGLLMVFAFATAAGAFAWYQGQKREAQVQICEDRTAQNEIIVDILKGSVTNAPPEAQDSPGVQNIKDGIARFEQLIIDCEDGL